MITEEIVPFFYLEKKIIKKEEYKEREKYILTRRRPKQLEPKRLSHLTK